MRCINLHEIAATALQLLVAYIRNGALRGMHGTLSAIPDSHDFGPELYQLSASTGAKSCGQIIAAHYFWEDP